MEGCGLMRVVHWSELSDDERNTLLHRRAIPDPELDDAVRVIVDAVQHEGDAALLRLTKQLDGVDLATVGIRVSEAEMDAAAGMVPGDVRDALDVAIRRVRQFHEKQLRPKLWMEEFPDGMRAGELSTPIESAGLYVPRGKGSFPSVLIMLGVPATVVGVPQVVVTTPPNPDGSVEPAALVVARRLGLAEVFRVGGAQAIAAMAFGTETVPAVAKLFGPGSPYVGAAKVAVSGVVDSGLRSGPSESLVYADDSVDPDVVALDVCNEAEHGPDSTAYLVTTSEGVVAAVSDRIVAVIQRLPAFRAGYVRQVLDAGGAIVFPDPDSAVGFIGSIPIEHLVLDIADPYSVVERIRYAGEIIIGPNTPIGACNFVCGPNAVLPTSGFSRSMSGLSSRDFLRTSSIVELSPAGLEAAQGPAATLAEYEGFPAHAMAVARRPVEPGR
jgi:histidinol dehydrogenase